MKRLLATISMLTLMGFAAEGWAGPAEEVAQLAAARVKALEQGDVEGYVAAFAEDAVLQSSFSPFRVEGKKALRAYFASLFQTYPKRRVTPRPPLTRSYNDDLVVQDTYGDLHATDEQGKPATYFTRSSFTWAKLNGQWQIVDQHTSRLPEPR